MDIGKDLPPSYEEASTGCAVPSAPTPNIGFTANTSFNDPGFKQPPYPQAQPGQGPQTFPQGTATQQTYYPQQQQPVQQQHPAQQPLIIQQPVVQPYGQSVQAYGQPVIMQPGVQPVYPTTAVYSQAQIVNPNIGSGPESISMTCPFCQSSIETSIKKSPSMIAYASSFMLCMLGLVFGCCLIPFFIDSCMDTEHNCPNCKRFLSKYSPLAGNFGNANYNRRYNRGW